MLKRARSAPPHDVSSVRFCFYDDSFFARVALLHARSFRVDDMGANGVVLYCLGYGGTLVPARVWARYLRWTGRATSRCAA